MPLNTLFCPKLKIGLCWGSIEAETKYFWLDVICNGQTMPRKSLFTKINGYMLSIVTIPWLWRGGISKYWPRFWEIGAQCRPTAAGGRFTLDPNFEEWGQYLQIPPWQRQGILIVMYQKLVFSESDVKWWYGIFHCNIPKLVSYTKMSTWYSPILC